MKFIWSLILFQSNFSFFLIESYCLKLHVIWLALLCSFHGIMCVILLLKCIMMRFRLRWFFVQYSQYASICIWSGGDHYYFIVINYSNLKLLFSFLIICLCLVSFGVLMLNLIYWISLDFALHLYQFFPCYNRWHLYFFIFFKWAFFFIWVFGWVDCEWVGIAYIYIYTSMYVLCNILGACIVAFFVFA